MREADAGDEASPSAEEQPREARGEADENVEADVANRGAASEAAEGAEGASERSSADEPAPEPAPEPVPASEPVRVREIPAAWAAPTMSPQMEKRMLRARMRFERDSMPVVDHARDSLAACRRLLGLDPVRPGATVALYAPLGSELSLEGFVRGAQDTLCLLAPVTLAGGRMEFVAVTPDELLARRRKRPDFLARPGRPLPGLPEGREAADPSSINLMIVPGLAFDRTCRRLGYGGGYYDAYLARDGLRALVAGVCFDEQLFSRPLPAEEHDRRVDVVVTPGEVIRLTPTGIPVAS